MAIGKIRIISFIFYFDSDRLLLFYKFTISQYHTFADVGNITNIHIFKAWCVFGQVMYASLPKQVVRPACKWTTVMVVRCIRCCCRKCVTQSKNINSLSISRTRQFTHRMIRISHKDLGSFSNKVHNGKRYYTSLRLHSFDPRDIRALIRHQIKSFFLTWNYLISLVTWIRKRARHFGEAKAFTLSNSLLWILEWWHHWFRVFSNAVENVISVKGERYGVMIM